MAVAESSPMESAPQASITNPTRYSCTHCGLDVPAGLISADRREQFCCSGCQTAFELIRAGGLEDYYRLANRQQRPVAAPSLQRNLAYDTQEFQELFVRQIGDDLREMEWAVSGIHCVACIWLIEKLPSLLPGVVGAEVHWAKSTVRLTWNPRQVELSRIASTMERLGYGVQPLRAGSAEAAATRENREQLVRLGIAGAAAGNNMLIAAALYLGMFSDLAPAIETLLRYTSCLVGIVSLAWPGRIFFRSAWQALRTRTPHMDLPIALGLGVGGISGTFNTLLGTGDIYFDSLSVLVFLLLVGRYIQYRQQRRTADAIDLLYRMTPRTARKIVAGEAVETPVELLREQDTLEVRANECFAADGEVVSGTTCVDESILTGESVPQSKGPGDEVLAGSQNLQSLIRLRVTATGAATRIGRIMGLVEQSSRQRPQIVEWANAVGAYFVVTVLVLAVVTFLFWSPTGLHIAFEKVVSILIVACPCALALATPLAISVALGRAAQRQILIKGGDVLQRLNRPGTIWLDKTGTLTQGCMRLMHWAGDRSVAGAVAALESHSTHPIARALSNSDFLSQFPEQPLPLPETSDVEQSSQGGISGRVGEDFLCIGNQNFLHSQGVSGDSDQPVWAEEMLTLGLSPVFIAVNHKLVAVAGVGDPLRPEAPEAVRKLQQSGWKVGILSGDHQVIVSGIARQLEMAPEMAQGGLLPEDKSRIVSSTDRRETTVMVGDGVNDSAALAAASVGIAVHGGAEASLQAAAVYLNQSGLGGIQQLLTASRRTSRAIRRNFAASLGYNLLAVVLAMGGWINPLAAALLMPLSSLTVVSLSLASRTFSD